jgi:hypothetical protein
MGYPSCPNACTGRGQWLDQFESSIHQQKQYDQAAENAPGPKREIRIFPTGLSPLAYAEENH